MKFLQILPKSDNPMKKTDLKYALLREIRIRLGRDLGQLAVLNSSQQLDELPQEMQLRSLRHRYRWTCHRAQRPVYRARNDCGNILSRRLLDILCQTRCKSATHRT